MADVQIIDQARAGSLKAFCDLYDIYKDQLYRYAFYRLGNWEDAEDTLQDCMLNAWRQIGNLKSSAAFHSWLFKILSGCCAEKIRKIITQKERIAALTLEGLKEEVQPDNAVDSLFLEQALAELDETSKDIVLLSVIGGFTSEEVGEMVGLKAGSVRSRLSRSLAKIRERIETEERDRREVS